MLACPNRAGLHGTIHDTEVEEDHRGKGLASQLLDYAITYARSVGMYKVSLTRKPHLSGLYEIHGFEKTISDAMRINLA